MKTLEGLLGLDAAPVTAPVAPRSAAAAAGIAVAGRRRGTLRRRSLRAISRSSSAAASSAGSAASPWRSPRSSSSSWPCGTAGSARPRGWSSRSPRPPGSSALGVWLYERRGQTQAALATVAAGLAALYASAAATTLHYHLLSPVLGLVIAGAVGAFALVTAVRWNSAGDRRDRDRRRAAGAGARRRRNAHELARVHDDRARSPRSASSSSRGWAWLAVVAYVVSVPQAASLALCRARPIGSG